MFLCGRIHIKNWLWFVTNWNATACLRVMNMDHKGVSELNRLKKVMDTGVNRIQLIDIAQVHRRYMKSYDKRERG